MVKYFFFLSRGRVEGGGGGVYRQLDRKVKLFLCNWYS